jgi:predicted metalloprotease with PDZ domain
LSADQIRQGERNHGIPWKSTVEVEIEVKLRARRPGRRALRRVHRHPEAVELRDGDKSVTAAGAF